MEESTSLNIIYLPDEITRQKAIELSEKVASKLPAEFVLGQGAIPHITIYQALFPTKNIEKIKDVVRQIASQSTPFEIEMSEFVANVVLGFVWWNCIKTDNIEKIYSEVIEKANPLREGLIPEGLKNYQGPEEKKREIQNYGSLQNHPHITISRLKNNDDGQKALDILGEKEDSVFKVDKIALGLMGDHGTVTEIIEEFTLLP